MKIKNGYNDKETVIKIYAQSGSRNAEVWIKQTGLDDKETLSYASIDELLDLKEEIESALKKVIGIKNEY
jgi:hypothetical protein